MKPGINEFFDINKFPKEPGITYYGISMPLLNNKQSPEECYKIDLSLVDKILVSNVGGIVGYSDGLYLNSKEEAMGLKQKFQKLIEEHKRAWLNLIKGNKFLIPSAFTFLTWQQLILECDNFTYYLVQLRKIYDKDFLFQKYVRLDIETTGREFNEYTVSYILEEILLDYLIIKGKVNLPNDYTKGKEEWILNCYTGKPHRSTAYIHQINPFQIKNEKNIYEDSFYDLTNRKLYEFLRMDIETFDFR